MPGTGALIQATARRVRIGDDRGVCDLPIPLLLPPFGAETMFTIRRDGLTDPQTRALLTLHLADMRDASPPGCSFALDLSGLQTPDVTVLTAWRGDRIAGVGALKMLADGAAEVKSMRTHPDFLRMGAADAILTALIADARARSVGRLSLETGRGPAFEPALTLYRRRGFEEGAAFSTYRDNGFSRFLHLDLDATAP